jgi:outer membrane protein TolC
MKNNSVIISTIILIMSVNSNVILASEPLLHNQPSLIKETGSLNIDYLTSLAEEHNPRLKTKYMEYEALKAKSPQVSSLPDPRFSYGYFISPIETKSGPQEHKFGLSQKFPLGGKLRLKESLALRKADQAYYRYMSTRLDIISEITKHFYEYAYVHQAIVIKSEHVKLLKAMESVALIKFRTGKISQSILIQIQIEQGKLEDEINELEALRPSLSSSILAAVGDSTFKILPWPDVKNNKLPVLEVHKLRKLLDESNPSLKVAELRRREGEVALLLAGKESVPDLTIGFEQYEIGGGSNATAATMSINLPLWRKRLRGARNEAESRLKSSDSNLVETGNRLLARLDMLLYFYNDGQRKVSLYNKTLIPKAKQAIDIALKGFQTGTVSFLELLDTERTLLEFELIGEKQFSDVLKRLAELEALVGTKLTNG